MFGSAINNKNKTEKNQLVKEGPCIFPFKHKSKTYTKCMPSEKGKKCATEVSKYGTMKKYGYCKKKKKLRIVQSSIKKKKKLRIVKEVPETVPKKINNSKKTVKLVNINPQKTIKLRAKKKLNIINDKKLSIIMPPYNTEFIGILSELEEYMLKKGEFMRSRAYQKAQQALINYKKDINNPEEIKGLKGIGPTIIKKLNEYIKTGKIEALEREKKDPIHILTQVFGIGPKKAKEFISKGITTLKDLNDNQEMLTENQKLGLKYYTDINKRIPRSEIKLYEKKLEQQFNKLNFPESKMMIVGSYRRGAKDSGDIDIILTDKAKSSAILEEFVKLLIKEKIILHQLTAGKTKQLLIAQLPKKSARRVDFLYSTPDEYPFAVLYFTGSKTFNTIMRQRALNMGYTLNEHGLYHMIDGNKGSKVDHKFTSEKDIFKFLKMKYKEPEERKSVNAVESISDNEEISDSLSPVSELMQETPILIKMYKKGGMKYLKTLDKDKLEGILEYANEMYYNNPDEEILSDDEYDIIKEYVEREHPDAAILKEIGAPIKGVKNKVKLPYPMPSMDKIKPSTKALEKWLKKYDNSNGYVLSAKLDGVSGLYTTVGIPKLYTRGNGVEGQDISYLIPYLKLPATADIVIRGEFIISKTNFSKYYSGKNARNTVAGLINSKTVNKKKLKYVDFVCYELIKPEKSPHSQLEYIASLPNTEVVNNFHLKTISNEILSKILVEWRSNYKYDIDGIIVTHNKIYTKRINSNPEHAFAFKMVLSDQKAEAKVVDVIWTPSKDGYLKPKIQIEPIQLGGVRIEFATGFNAAFIEKNKIGIGSIVKIIRSGDVIPHIVLPVIKPTTPLMPTGIDYKWNSNHVDILLTNKGENKIVRKKNIAGFFKNIETEGLSDGIVNILMEHGNDSVSKILSMTKEDYLKLPGFKEKRASKIHTNVKTAIKKLTLVKLMKASNIFGRGLGEKKLGPIMEKYPKIIQSSASNEDKINKVMQVEGLGRKSAAVFVEQIPLFIDFIKSCGLDYLLTKNILKVKKDESHPLYGKYIIMSGFRDQDIVSKIEKHGGIIANSVSNKTFVVLVKEMNADSGKIDKAKEMGIPIMLVTAFSSKYL